MTNCCVPECHSLKKRSTHLSFFTFPKPGREVSIIDGAFEKSTVDVRNAWISKLQIIRKVSPYMRVCSLHFEENDFFPITANNKRRNLKPFAIPSMNLPGAKQIAPKSCTNLKKSHSLNCFLKPYSPEFVAVCDGNKAVPTTLVRELEFYTPTKSVCDAKKVDNLQREALNWIKPLEQTTDNTANPQENDRRIKEEEVDINYEQSFSANGNQYGLYPPLTIKKEEENDIEIEEHEVEENTHQNAPHNVFDKNSLIVVNRDQAIQMETQNMNPIKLKTNTVNKDPPISIKESTCGNKGNHKNLLTPIRIHRVRNDRRNIQRKISKVFIKHEAHNSPNTVRRKRNIHQVELCVLCSTDLSRCRTKKSLSDCLEVILKVTDVDVTQYKIPPYSCKVCYNYILFIQKFQKQVANAKGVICEKLSNLVNNQKPCEFEFVNVDTNEKVPTLHALDNQADIEIELDDAEEIHVTETQNGDVVMTNFNKDTSKITNLGITQSSLQKIGIVGSKNIVPLPMTAVNIEGGSTLNSHMKTKAGIIGRSTNTVPLSITEVNNKRGNTFNSYMKNKISIKGKKRNSVPLPITEVNIEEGNAFNSYMKNKTSIKGKKRNSVPLPITEVNIEEGNPSNSYMKNKTRIKARNKKTVPLPITEVNIEGENNFNDHLKNNKFNRKIKIKLGFSSGKMKEPHKGSMCKICGKLLKRGSMRDHMQSHKSVLKKPSNKKRSSHCRRSYSHTNNSYQLMHEEKKSVCHICK